MKVEVMTEQQQLLLRCKETLQQHYGDQFAGLILYGSEATGKAWAGSDIDLLVLLRGAFDFFAELRTVVRILYPAQLDCERHLSVKPAALEEYEAGSLQFYRNIRSEGQYI